MNEPTAQERKQWNKKISRACRNDYRVWVSRWNEMIEKADRRGDLKEIHKGVRALSGKKSSFNDTQPTLNSDGKLLKSPEELANS